MTGRFVFGSVRAGCLSKQSFQERPKRGFLIGAELLENGIRDGEGEKLTDVFSQTFPRRKDAKRNGPVH